MIIFPLRLRYPVVFVSAEEGQSGANRAFTVRAIGSQEGSANAGTARSVGSRDVGGHPGGETNRTDTATGGFRSLGVKWNT